MQEPQLLFAFLLAEPTVLTLVQALRSQNNRVPGKKVQHTQLMMHDRLVLTNGNKIPTKQKKTQHLFDAEKMLFLASNP